MVKPARLFSSAIVTYNDAYNHNYFKDFNKCVEILLQQDK